MNINEILSHAKIVNDLCGRVKLIKEITKEIERIKSITIFSEFDYGVIRGLEKARDLSNQIIGHYCDNCNTWLSEQCPSKTCDFCKDRLKTPKRVELK